MSAHARGVNIARKVMRSHLADVFAEVACFSTKESNRLLNDFPDYRHALCDLSHGFWREDASKMLNRAQAVEFDLRIADERRNQHSTEHGVVAFG